MRPAWLRGLRRVTGQRIVLRRDGVSCTVYGLANRLPVARPISLDDALALRRQGVRTVVVRERSSAPTGAALEAVGSR
jgi:hypothetical protein